MIFEVLRAVSVKRAVVLVVRPCRLCFSTMKSQVEGSSIFMVETELVASSKTSVSFCQNSYPKRVNSLGIKPLSPELFFKF